MMEVQDLELAEMSVVSQDNSAGQQRSAAEKIEDWLISYLADLLEMDKDEVDVTTPFERYGLDSATTVGLVGDLEEWLGCNLDSTLLYDYPTIKSVSEHLAAS